MTQVELARRMDRPLKTINEIIKTKAAITADTAYQLELALGIPARVWSNLETAYRDHQARERAQSAHAAHARWAERFPLKELVRHGLITKAKTAEEYVPALLGFFGVSNPQAWEREWEAAVAQFRASPAFESSPHAIAAWLRWGERQAASRETAEFSAGALRKALVAMRPLTRRDIALVIDQVEDMLADAGVVLALTPEIGGAHLSGAARWLSPRKALIQLSLRHKRDDQFWFTLYHEASHLLTNGRADVLDAPGGSGDVDAEDAADKSARDLLIPPRPYREFVARGDFGPDAVRAFAAAQDVSPGIVVGRLQRDDHISSSRLNSLKKTVSWAG